MRLKSGPVGEVESEMLDLTQVSLADLRSRDVSPVLMKLLEERFLRSMGEIFPFQSYIDREF
ncbi:hypothetical protein [Actinoplanes sp. NPDC020271]|uniref:hypothetical protein n=1 Tax=Actinoplanes sp. NPDC020271 TaxID=3363896 RepID=UPI00379C9FA3